MNEISLDLIRVTEAGAIAAAHWVGSGNKIAADKSATDAMRARLNKMNFGGRIVIGEGKKDKAPGLFEGEKVGLGRQFGRVEYDIAIDPIDGTRPTSTGGPEAMSTIAISKRNCMYSTDEHYMLKLALGPVAASRLNMQDGEFLLELRPQELAEEVAYKIVKDIKQFTVCILDRPRHKVIIEQFRYVGCRIKLINDCDVSAAIAAGLPDTGIDMYYGIGGAPEAILSAAASKCLRGRFEVQDIKTGRLMGQDELVKGDCAFAATGITDGSLLRGVRFGDFIRHGLPTTHSVFMRSASGTIRWETTTHGN